MTFRNSVKKGGEESGGGVANSSTHMETRQKGKERGKETYIHPFKNLRESLINEEKSGRS